MKQLTCATIRRLLPASLDEEVPVHDRIAVYAHLTACPACAADARAIREVGDALRAAALSAGEGWTEALAGLPGGVVSRLKAERHESVARRVGRLFDDMHLVWAAVGATAATVACAVIIHGMLLFAARERPDSLAAILAALAAAGSNGDPMTPESGMLLPRADPDAVMAAAVVNHGRNKDVVFALAAVVTRDGSVSHLQLLSDGPAQHAAGLGDRKELLDVLDAASTARFEPARYAGTPVAVNMIWLLAHTTVRGKLRTYEPGTTWRTPEVPPVHPGSARDPSPEAEPFARRMVRGQTPVGA